MKKEQKPRYIALIVAGVTLTALVSMLTADPVDRAQGEGLQLTHQNDDDHPQNQPQLLSATASSPSGSVEVTLHYWRRGEDELDQKPMERVDETTLFIAALPGLPRGQGMEYYLEATDRDGHKVVLPQKEHYSVAFEGRPWAWARLAHILLMLAAFLIFLHVLYYALYELQLGGKGGELFWTILWGDICFSLSGLPLGWLIAHQVHGVAWSGIPVGWNITDNKTLIVFLFWTTTVILRRTNRIHERSLAKLAIYGLVLTVVVFLIPHGA